MGNLFVANRDKVLCDEHMEQKTKLVVLTVALIVAISGGLLAVMPFAAAAEQEIDVPTYDDTDVALLLNREGIQYCIRRRDAFVRRFLTQGSLAQVEGEIMGISNHILVVNDDGQTLNIIMPGKWVYDGNTIELSDLFDGTPFSIGQHITVDTLKLSLDRDTHVITGYLAYAFEIDGVSATALLPFNVEELATN